MKKILSFILTILLLPLVGCATQSQTITETVAAPDPTAAVVATPNLNAGQTIYPGEGEGELMITEIPILGRDTVDTVLETFGLELWPDASPIADTLEVGADYISYRVDEENDENSANSRMEITIFRNDQPIQTISAGESGPINVIWGFAAYEGSWYLEINRYERSEEELDDDTVGALQIQGDIIQDGVSLNEREGYQESFAFTVLAGKVFYFYQREGGYGYCYDGVEHFLDFITIAHHQCCSGAQMNPRFYGDRVVVFAGKGDQQYLVLLETKIE